MTVKLDLHCETVCPGLRDPMGLSSVSWLSLHVPTVLPPLLGCDCWGGSKFDPGDTIHCTLLWFPQFCSNSGNLPVHISAPSCGPVSPGNMPWLLDDPKMSRTHFLLSTALPPDSTVSYVKALLLGVVLVGMKGPL